MRNQMKDELKAEMRAEMKAEMITLEEKFATVQAKIPTTVSKAVRDLPYVLVCAYQDEWTQAEETITYGSLLADYNNAENPGGGNGHLDIKSGVFTALTHGYYKVTFS